MTHIQKAVKSVDDRGKYQFMLVGVLIFIYIELGLILLGSSFIYMNPTWSCTDVKDPSEDAACQNPNCHISKPPIIQPMTSQPRTTLIFTVMGRTPAVSSNQHPTSVP